MSELSVALNKELDKLNLAMELANEESRQLQLKIFEIEDKLKEVVE